MDRGWRTDPSLPVVMPDLGYLFCIFPCLIGSLVMVLVAVIFNNLEPERAYPKHWYFPGPSPICVDAVLPELSKGRDQGDQGGGGEGAAEGGGGAGGGLDA